MRFLALAALVATPATAAQRSFTVTDFNRVRIDGPYKVVLTTNVAPFGRATGAAASLDSLSLDVQGQTLIIRSNGSAATRTFGKPTPLTIAIGTHDLRSAWVNGSGSLDIDQVKGQSFDLAVQGSGSANVAKVTVDTFRAGITGSGSSTVAGKVLGATVMLRGAGNFDGAGLTAKDATVAADGNAVIALTATGTAKVDASGPVSINLSGRPTCTIRAQGTAEVNGCR